MIRRLIQTPKLILATKKREKWHQCYMSTTFSPDLRTGAQEITEQDPLPHHRPN